MSFLRRHRHQQQTVAANSAELPISGPLASSGGLVQQNTVVAYVSSNILLFLFNFFLIAYLFALAVLLWCRKQFVMTELLKSSPSCIVRSTEQVRHCHFLRKLVQFLMFVQSSITSRSTFKKPQHQAWEASSSVHPLFRIKSALT